MGRFRDTTPDDGEDTIDISPLIDCVFILLIFFIVTTTFVEESGVGLDKPQAAPPVRMEQENISVVLALTDKGEILHEGRVVGMSGIRPLVKDALRQDDEAPVVVQAAPEAQTGMLMRVVDEAKLAGASKVSVSTKASKG